MMKAEWAAEEDSLETVQNMLGVEVDPGQIETCLRLIRARVGPGQPTPRAIVLAGFAVLDSLLASAPPADCKPGCWYCCTLPVSITGVEANLLAQVASGQPDLRRAINVNAKRADGLGTRDYVSAKIRCAFLGKDNLCRAYAVRPWACRYYHSADVNACRAGYGTPDTAIPLNAATIAIFKAVAMAAAFALTPEGRHPTIKASGEGELHDMVKRAIRRRQTGWRMRP